MDTLPHNVQASQSSPSLTLIEKEVQQLQREREKLIARRETVRRETLQSLADAFARKLQAAGLSVREGIAALKPYEHVKLDEQVVHAPAHRPTNTAFRRSTAPAQPQAKPAAVVSRNPAETIEGYAQEVIGSDWKQWLDAPNLLLSGERPKDMLDRKGGAAKVHALLTAYAQER